MADLLVAQNNVTLVLSTAVLIGDTHIHVVNSSLAPTTYPYPLTIENEIMYATNNNTGTNTITVTRGQESTSAVGHATGLSVYLDITAAHINNIVSNLPNKNAIVNGACHVTQRPALTLVKDAYGFGTVDMFEGMATGTLVSAGTLTDVASGSWPNFKAIHFSGVTLTGTGILYLRHRIESKDAMCLVNKATTFWCYGAHDIGSNKDFTIYIRKANAADNFTAVTAIANSAAISVNVGNLVSLTVPDMGDCTNGIEIEIKMEVGAITTKNVYLYSFQLERSNVPTPFEFRPYSHERTLCQRYCTGITTLVAGEAIGFGYAISDTTAHINIPLPVTMRITPSLTATATDWVLDDAINAPVDLSAIVVSDQVYARPSWVVLKCSVAAGAYEGLPVWLASDGTVGRILLLTAGL
jgi:hypothetical protein